MGNTNSQENKSPNCSEILSNYSPNNINDLFDSQILDIIRCDGCAIRHVKNPTYKMEETAVKYDPYALEYIKHPGEIIMKLALKQLSYEKFKYLMVRNKNFFRLK